MMKTYKQQLKAIDDDQKTFVVRVIMLENVKRDGILGGTEEMIKEHFEHFDQRRRTASRGVRFTQCRHDINIGNAVR